MTVASETSFVRYTGDGTTVAFTITFPFQEATDIRLFVDNALVTTGFTVTGGVPSGTLTFGAAPANGADIFIRRLVPILQDKAYPTNDTFPSVTHEAALDKLTYIAQQQQRNQTLSLSFPESLNITAGLLPAPEDDAILVWDGTTGTIKNGPTTASFETATNTAVAAAATATTQAGISTTQAGLSEDNKDYAEEWAINPEDDPVSVAAGGDDSTTFSALHWAAKAADSAASVDLPALGSANHVLQVNSAGNALEYGLVATDNIADDAVTVGKIGSGAATNGQVLTADGAGGVAFEDAAGGGAWVPIQTQTVSSPVTSVDFTSGIDGTYKAYAVFISDVVFASTAVTFGLRTSVDGGANFDASAGNYEYSRIGASNVNEDANLIRLSANTDSAFGIVYIINPAGTTLNTGVQWDITARTGTNPSERFSGGGLRMATAAINALRFFSAANITAGTFTLYGLAGA